MPGPITPISTTTFGPSGNTLSQTFSDATPGIPGSISLGVTNNVDGVANLGDPLSGISSQLASFNSSTLASGTDNQLPDSILNVPGLSSSLNNASNPASSSSPTSTAQQTESSVLNALAGSASGSSLLGLSLGRVGAFLLGLVFIAGGIYLFGRPSITAAAGAAIKTATVV